MKIKFEIKDYNIYVYFTETDITYVFNDNFYNNRTILENIKYKGCVSFHGTYGEFFGDATVNNVTGHRINGEMIIFADLKSPIDLCKRFMKLILENDFRK